MPIPDNVTVAFEGNHTQFNGITLSVLRKENNVLLMFPGIDGFDDKKSRQAVDLLGRLKKRSEFTIVEAADVPDAHYNAPDISDAERTESIFLAPPPGNTPERVQLAVLSTLKTLRATPKTGSAGSASPTII